MSILATSPNNIIFINMEIAEELKDFNSAVMIDHLVNLSLPLPEKTIFTKEKVGKILTWASPREINKAIRNLEKREIFDKSGKPKGWIVNIENLEKFVEEMTGGAS